VLWVGSRALLLGGDGSVQIYWRLRKRLLCVDRVRYIWSVTIHGPRVGYVWPVSVKDRWVDPMSKYWMYRSHASDMSPVSLVAYCQQKLVFFSPSHWLLWERSWVRSHGSVSRRVVGWVGSPSSSGRGSVQICWWLRERLLCVGRVRYVWSGTIRGLRVGCVWHVGQVFPTGCTSIRIIVTLGYE
jgi:hypothetical protein